MDEPALSWFKWMQNNNQITTWKIFYRLYKLGLRIHNFDDLNGSFQTTQQTSVTDYQTQLELLSNRVVGLSSNALLSCLISRLRPHIKRQAQELHL